MASPARQQRQIGRLIASAVETFHRYAAAQPVRLKKSWMAFTVAGLVKS